MVEEKPIVEVLGDKVDLIAEQKKLDQEQVDKAEEEKPQSLLDKAKEENDRKARLLDREEKLLDRREAMKVTEELGGKSELSEKTTKEDKDKEAAKGLLPEGMDCPGVTD